MQASFDKPVAVTAFGVLIDKSRKKFSPFNPNDEEKEFTLCTTEDEQVEIMDAVFGAAIEAGVNVQQYQWGQRGFNSNPSGPVRRQDGSEEGNEEEIHSSFDEGYGAYDGSGARSQLRMI